MMDELNTVFDDSNITVVGKIFLAAMTAVTLGKPPHIRVRCTPAQVDAIKLAVDASRAFQAALDQPSNTVQDIMDKLQAKNAAAKAFEAQLGLPWPL